MKKYKWNCSSCDIWIKMIKNRLKIDVEDEIFFLFISMNDNNSRASVGT